VEVPEKVIRERAFARISALFGIPVQELRESFRFGEELHPSVASAFRDNEVEDVVDDIVNVSTPLMIREFGKGVWDIKTLGDYCDHMVRCYELSPRAVSKVLKMITSG
jgi:hypothetical protein